jgi:chromosome segregation ATPase
VKRERLDIGRESVEMFRSRFTEPFSQPSQGRRGTGDAMGAFWDQVVNLVQPSDRLAGGQRAVAAMGAASLAPSRYSPNASLEAIGMQNETLRAQIEEVEHGFEHLEEVRGLFHGLLSPMSELLADFEATRARLQETKTRLGFLEDAHEGLNARHAAALAERDLVAETKNALLRENREMEQRAQRTDAALGDAQLGLREHAAATEKLEREVDIQARRTIAFADEIRRLKDELSSKDQSLANLELSVKVATDQGALLSQENATLRDSAQSLASRLETSSRRVADCESLLDHGQHRLAAVEQALAEEQSTHASLRVRHLDHVERSRSEAATLGNTVHAVRGRVEVTNKILDQTRAQLREKIDELRAAERRLLESGIQIDGLEKGGRALRDDLAAVNERVVGAERVREALVDQVHGLSEAARVKEAALQSALRAIEQLTVRVEEATTARQRARDELEKRTAALQDEIARLRAERQLADGALVASRTERQQARRAAPASGDPHREAASAIEMADPPPPQQNNVTKLPRSA